MENSAAVRAQHLVELRRQLGEAKEKLLRLAVVRTREVVIFGLDSTSEIRAGFSRVGWLAGEIEAWEQGKR